MEFRKISERVFQSLGAMRVMMAYLPTIEQHHLQAISPWFYEIATSRVQKSIKLAPKTHYFTWLHGGSLAPYVLAQSSN